MSQTNAFSIGKPGAPGPGANDPHAAASARARIAGIPNHYSTAPMPSKKALAKSSPPVSPLAEAQPLSSELPRIGHISKFSVRRKDKKENTDKQPSGKKIGLPSRLRPVITAIITFVVLFSIFKSPIILSQLSYLTSKPQAAPPAANTADVVSSDPVISIPKINVSAPLVFANSNVESAIQKDLENGVVHYAGTATPGQQGNSVIFGHSSNDWWEPGNYKFIFVLLDKLVPGDTFTVNYGGHKYLYQVSEVKVVAPTDLSVIAQTSDAEMTLITCTPPGTSWKRLAVKAKQTTPYVQKSDATTQATSSGASTLPSNSPGIGNQLSKLWDQFVSLFSGPSGSTQPATNTSLPSAK